MNRFAPGLLAVLLGAFPAAGQAQTGALPLDRQLTLTSGGSRQMTSQKPTLFLARKDGIVTAQGDAGCNRWNGTAVVAGSGFTLHGMVGTQRACSDPALMKAEQDFLSSLESVKRWRMDGNVLVLEGGKGSLRFEPAAQN